VKNNDILKVKTDLVHSAFYVTEYVVCCLIIFHFLFCISILTMQLTVRIDIVLKTLMP